MPETNVILDDEDEERLIKAILARDAHIVPNYNESPEHSIIMTWKDYQTHRKQRLFFVVSQKLTMHPLESRRIEGGFYEGKYSIEQRHAGPTLDLFIVRPYYKDGVRWLMPSAISHYPSFLNPETKSFDRAPKALSQFYKDIVAFMKVGSHTQKTKHNTYIYATQAIVSLRTTSRFGVDGVVPDL